MALEEDYGYEVDKSTKKIPGKTAKKLVVKLLQVKSAKSNVKLVKKKKSSIRKHGSSNLQPEVEGGGIVPLPE